MDTLKNRYAEVHSKLIMQLKDQSYVCLTADVWSSRSQAYIGITVHYLTAAIERKSFLLAFRRLKERQTNDVLAKVIDAVLKELVPIW